MRTTYRINWTSHTIKTNEDAEHVRQLFRQTAHTAAAFDTETSGLSHMRDLPFLYQFGWYDKETLQGWTFAIDLEAYPQLGQQVIKVWHALVKSVPKYIGQNVKYDLHMITNIGLPYTSDNISDLMSWIRLGTDAIPVRKGGAPLELKKFSTRYIDIHAADHEHHINAERTAIAKELNVKLRKKLGWTQKVIDAFFNDKLNEASNLPEDKRKAYEEWHNELPEYLKPFVTGAVDSEMISYRTLNREHMIEYGHIDIILVLEAYDRLEETVRARGNLPAIAIEESNIYPVFEMERTGFKANKEYLLHAQQVLNSYIRARRKDMCTIAQQNVTINQHALIKDILYELGVEVTSTGAEELDLLLNKLKREGTRASAVDFIEVLQELRTLEKWYSTYIVRFLIDLKFGDMLYTQINLSGAVSGRVTSDFQQFPKDAIIGLDGVELFKPRRIFEVPDGYKGIVYLDYSQIELRLQAMYTILVGKGEGDINLCRAYMPYKCHCVMLGGITQEFRPDVLFHIQHAYDTAWFLNEAPDVQWTPTDVHGATTKEAFGIDEENEEFPHLRYIGKRVNFAKQYGAQKGKIAEMFPDFTLEQIARIDGAYYKAFPGVKAYHEYCYNLARISPYGQNLYGVKYYNVSGHNLINMLIQGTGAYVLKTKIPIINAYLKEHGYKSKLQMQIHDELSFLWHEADDASIFFEIKQIMEDFPDFIVPIVAEMEVTYTTWAEKVKVKNIGQLKAA